MIACDGDKKDPDDVLCDIMNVRLDARIDGQMMVTNQEVIGSLSIVC